MKKQVIKIVEFSIQIRFRLATFWKIKKKAMKIVELSIEFRFRLATFWKIMKEAIKVDFSISG